MGLFSALTASVAGLTSQGEAISVISDNLSNSNTIGYKANRTLFSQLVTTSGAGGTTFNAGGVASNIQRSQNTQGSLISSSNVTDLALSGNGFFAVADSQEITTDTGVFYTRAGAFTEDRDGFLATPAGQFLQGFRTDSSGEVINAQAPESIELQSVGVAAAATTEVNIGANLTSTQGTNSAYDTTTTLAAALDVVTANPGGQADFLTEIRLFDAQGSARDVTVAFTKRSANFWDFSVITDGVNVEGGTSEVNTRIADGTLRFDTDGNLKFSEGTSFNVQWAGGVEEATVNLDLGEYRGGNVVSSTTGLDFTDNVLDVSVEDNTFGIGTFDVVFTGAGAVELQQGGVTIETATVPTTSTQREIVFATSGVRLTVSPQFDAAPGGFPNTIGSFTVVDEPPLLGGGGTDGVVQFAAAFNTGFVRQDGFGSGTLSSIQVDEEGLISGTFTNGQTQALWRISIGIFQNPAGLESVSNNLLRPTDASGQVLLRQAGSGGVASVVSGALEGSTVDIATEFSQMIVTQRAYQANSSVLSTVDQMLNELLQIR